jgi:Aerotolerance regulator N-terminal/von Willebrand factor type A domain
MFFLNLTAGEFLTLLGGVGGLITALYLLDKSKRKKVVSTLRFWTPARSAEELQSRRRMREPWSLILQLLGLLLLLLAIAQLQWGVKQWRGKDHILLLDTSAWSAGRSGVGTVLDSEKRLARDYAAALPGADRVMVVRVDALATPVTPFTASRKQLVGAIDSSVSQASALNLEQAFSFAVQTRRWSDGQQGEIVYTGVRMISGDETEVAAPPNLRVLSPELNREHVGIRRLTAKRDEQESNSWNSTVTLKNFGIEPHVVRLQAQFAGTHFAARSIALAPHQESAAEYSFFTGSAGELIASITPPDVLATDQQASLRLPKSGALQVTVYTKRAEELRPLFESNHRIVARFEDPAHYSNEPQLGAQKEDVVVLDGFAPKASPTLPSLWISPPREGSPLAVKGIDYDAAIKTWHNETLLGAGLHAKETHIATAEIFETYEGDIPVANTAGGPVIVARDSRGNYPRFAVIGFDPLQGQLKFEVTTPLLFANLLRWLSPESFRTLDVSAEGVGAATVVLDPKERIDRLRVVDDGGLVLPFTVRNGVLQLFAAEPTVVHVYSGDRERVLSLSLPEVGEVEWKAPPDALKGLPRRSRLQDGPVDLWKWLAAAGIACLLVEWFLFGRQRRAKQIAVSKKAAVQREPELAAK